MRHRFDTDASRRSSALSLAGNRSPDDLLNSASREAFRLRAALFPFLQRAFRNLQLQRRFALRQIVLVPPGSQFVAKIENGRKRA
jgi:hypothetical protein